MTGQARRGFVDEKLVPFIYNGICSKRAFTTKSQAKKALKSLRDGKPGMKKRGSIYQCPRCDQWHLTSQEQR